MSRFTSISLLPLMCFLTEAAGQSIVGDKIATYFRPYQTDLATLAPDGRHLAYSMREGEKVYVLIVDVDDPKSKVTVALADDSYTIPVDGPPLQRPPVLPGDLSPPPSYTITGSNREKTPAHATLLRWTSPRRLVIVDNTPSCYGVDADGQKPRELCQEKDFDLMPVINPAPDSGFPPNITPITRRFTVLPPSGDDPESVIVQAYGRPSAGRKITIGTQMITTGLFAIDPQNGKIRGLSEVDYPGEPLFDKQHEARVLLTPSKLLGTQTFRYLPPGAVWTNWVDLDQYLDPKTGPGFSIAPENYYRQRSIPLGFDYNPDILFFASNVGRDTYGVYALDLRRKTRTSLAIEDSHHDLIEPGGSFAESPLVFDRRQHRLVGVRYTGDGPATAWMDQELAQLQAALNRKFPSRFVEIIDWDDARTRFLFLVSGPSEPGRYYVFLRPENRLVEFVRKAPWLDANAVNVAKSFAFDTPAGVHLTGVLTLPTTKRLTPPPLLFYCHDGLAGRVSTAFNGEVQALADMGFVVAQVNYRGSSGFGLSHRDALQTGIDKIPIEDIRATIEWIATHQQINRQRVALLGRGFGGYLALRAVQQFPAEFRCAITIDAPTDLASWLLGNETTVNERRRQLLGDDRTRLQAVSPVNHVKPGDKPVFLIQYPNGADVPRAHATAMRSALDRENVPHEYLEITDEFSRGLPGAQLKVYSAIEEFLNYYVYDWRVNIGKVKKIE